MTYFETWLNLLTNMKRSKNTVETYGRNVRQFLMSEFESIDNQGKADYEAVTIDDVLEYNESTFNADSSKNLSQIAIHLYWGFLAERGIIEKNNLERTKLISLEEPVSDAFSLEEVRDIYTRVNNSPFKRCAVRDTAIMKIMLTIPVRKSELRNMKREDYSKNNLVFRNRKGKKNTVVGLSQDLIQTLNAYLATRNDNSEYLFVTESGNGMSKDSFDNLVNKYAGCNPHRLRATAATMLYKSGVQIETIESIGGWDRGSQTLRRNYLRIDEDTMRSSLEHVTAFVKGA